MNGDAPTKRFRSLVSRQVQHRRDVDGRPLGEQRADSYTSTTTEMATCPYAGSRHQHAHPMNVSALRQIRTEWAEILRLLRWLNARYRQLRGRSVQTDLDLYFVTGSGVHLLDFLCLRRGAPDVAVPRPLGGLYKVCLGFQFAMFQRNFEARLAGGHERCVGADDLYRQLDERSRLVGPNEVCAGPESMIKEAYESLTSPQAEAEGDIPGLDAAAEQGARFGFHFSRYWYNSMLFLILRSRLVRRLESLLPESQWSDFHRRAQANVRGYIFEGLEEFTDALTAATGFGQLQWLTDPGRRSGLPDAAQDHDSILQAMVQLESSAKECLSADLIPALNNLGYPVRNWTWDDEDWRYWALWTTTELAAHARETSTSRTVHG